MENKMEITKNENQLKYSWWKYSGELIKPE